MPTGFVPLSSSKTNSVVMECCSILCSAFAARSDACILFGDLCISSMAGRSRNDVPFSSARRKSPSVITPAREPSDADTPVQPSFFDVISYMAAFIKVSSETIGSASPECIRSLTVNSNFLPSAPPG